MELALDKIQAKVLLKEVVLQLLQEKRNLFSDLVIEALEDAGLANAIREGRQGDLLTKRKSPLF